MPYVIGGLTRGKERVSFLYYSVASNSILNGIDCFFACVVPVPMPIVKKKRKTQHTTRLLKRREGDVLPNRRANKGSCL